LLILGSLVGGGLRRPSLAVIGTFWIGLVTSGALPLPVWAVVSGLAALVLLMLLARSGRVVLLLFLGSTFLLGVLRSPEACWKRIEGVGSGGRQDEFPCIVGVRTSSFLPVWGEPAKVRVESVAVGYAWLENKQVYLRGPDLGQVLSIDPNRASILMGGILRGAMNAKGLWGRWRPNLSPIPPKARDTFPVFGIGSGTSSRRPAMI
jgi:hypothetical protein